MLRVVFVPRRSRIRPYKMAKALKYTGKVELILLCEESFYDPALFDGLFNEVHFFTRKTWFFKLPKAEKIYRRLNERFGFGFSKMIKKLKELNPDLVHCFAEPYNHIQCILKNTKFPVIMSDGADFTGITEGLDNVPQRIKIQEKYCFENVSGIVHKGPEYEIEYYRLNGFKINCPEITWFDHCDDDLIIKKEPRKIKQDDPIHIVYTGIISTDPSQKYVYYIDFAEEMARQKIHFHIYPNPYQYNVAVEYRKLARESEYFHFHAPLSYRDLGKEVANYDWGLWWHDQAGGDRYTEDKNKVSIGNKLFTYLESGLPVIVGEHMEYGRKLNEEFAYGVVIVEEDIKNLKPILIKDYNSMMIQVSNTSDKFRLSKNAEILIDFYNAVRIKNKNV